MPPEIQFEPTKHEYRLNGRAFVSVTKAIQMAGLSDYTGLDPFYAERGTAVHLACEFDDKGTLDEATLDPQILPYLKSYREGKATSGIVILQTEKRGVHEALGFAGTIDRIVRLNGRDGVLDLKTGHPAPWHPIQTAGYAMMENAKAPLALARWVLYLSGEGKLPRLVEHKEPGDFLVWQAALTIAKWKRVRGYDK